MPFQQATKNRFLQFDIKVTTESGFTMYKNNKPGRERDTGLRRNVHQYKNNKPGREPFSRDESSACRFKSSAYCVKEPSGINGFRPGDHFFGASFFHQFSFIHDKDAVAYIAYQRKIMGDE